MQKKALFFLLGTVSCLHAMNKQGGWQFSGRSSYTDKRLEVLNKYAKCGEVAIEISNVSEEPIEGEINGIPNETVIEIVPPSEPKKAKDNLLQQIIFGCHFEHGMRKSSTRDNLMEMEEEETNEPNEQEDESTKTKEESYVPCESFELETFDEKVERKKYMEAITWWEHNYGQKWSPLAIEECCKKWLVQRRKDIARHNREIKNRK